VNEIEIKTERLARCLGGLYGGVMLNAQYNFAWITAGGSNAIDTSRENGAATILVTSKGRRFLIANNIEMKRLLAEQVDPSFFEPVEFNWQKEKAEPELVRLLAGDLANGQVIADIPFTAVPAMESLFAHFRYELTDQEIVRYRDLGSDVAEAISSTVAAVRQGQTENEIANTMRFELARRNIRSVVTLVAADGRIAAYRHPVPTENRWKKTLLLVTCAKRQGLIASMSRIVSIGEPSNELKRKTEAAAFVHAKLQHATRNAVSHETNGAELHSVAEQAYRQCGFPDEINNHHQGGATGYRTRDWVAHPASHDKLFARQAFAWNPSITGTKVEDTVVRNGNEIEVFTKSVDFPLIETTIDGRTYCSHGILTI
jgi:Xaa-Pro aminopeptidase